VRQACPLGCRNYHRNVTPVNFVNFIFSQVHHNRQVKVFFTNGNELTEKKNILCSCVSAIRKGSMLFRAGDCAACDCQSAAKVVPCSCISHGLCSPNRERLTDFYQRNCASQLMVLGRCKSSRTCIRHALSSCYHASLVILKQTRACLELVQINLLLTL